METIQALKSRRCIRVYEAKPIPTEVIEELIDCGRLAATARNVQPWEFVVITKRPALLSLAEVCEYGKFIAQASCCIAVFCQDTKYFLEDGCAATQNILVAATAHNLASCWVAGDKKDYTDKVREMLGVPAGYKLISLIPLGYAKTPSPHPPKRSLKEVLHWETF
jgi:nitroreductase